jgi:hypothetical protein
MPTDFAPLHGSAVRKDKPLFYERALRLFPGALNDTRFIATASPAELRWPRRKSLQHECLAAVTHPGRRILIRQRFELQVAILHIPLQ